MNLGSIFVHERWLFPSMFLESARGDSELAAVTAYVKAHGIDLTREKWEQVYPLPLPLLSDIIDGVY